MLMLFVVVSPLDGQIQTCPSDSICPRCKFSPVLLCVPSLIQKRRLDRAIEYRMTDGVVDGRRSCTWCIWGPLPCFDLLRFSLYLVSLSCSPPCRPTALLPPSHPRRPKTMPPMTWWVGRYQHEHMGFCTKCSTSLLIFNTPFSLLK